MLKGPLLAGFAAVQPGLGTASLPPVVDVVAPPAAEVVPPSPAAPVVEAFVDVVPPLPPEEACAAAAFVEVAAAVLSLPLLGPVVELGPSTPPLVLGDVVASAEAVPLLPVVFWVPPVGLPDSEPSLLQAASATTRPDNQCDEIHRRRITRAFITSSPQMVTHAGAGEASHGLGFGGLAH